MKTIKKNKASKHKSRRRKSCAKLQSKLVPVEKKEEKQATKSQTIDKRPNVRSEEMNDSPCLRSRLRVRMQRHW